MTDLATERLALRALTLDDVPALAKILADPEVMRYSVRGVCDEAVTRQFIRWCVACYTDRGFGPWAMVAKDTSELVGFCGVGPERVAGIEEDSLGYRLARRYWNKGLATEAADAALRDVFSRARVRSVVAIVEPENTASLRVAEKAGFTTFDMIEFQGRPVRLYRLLRSQWHTSTNAARV